MTALTAIERTGGLCARTVYRAACMALCLALNNQAAATPTTAEAAPAALPASQPQDAAELLARLRTAHPGTSFGAVYPTPIPGLFQVTMGENVAFVSAGDTRYMVFGALFDTVAMRDLTRRPQRGAAAGPAESAPQAAFSSLPLDDAITVVRGRGERRMAVFSDPRCRYCMDLEAELRTLDNVTIHYFLVPYLGRDDPVAIWCAPDRLAAWQAAMQGQRTPKLRAACSHPIDRNLALAGRLKVRGTPTMLFANGKRLESAAPAAEIETYLAISTPARKDHD